MKKLPLYVLALVLLAACVAQVARLLRDGWSLAAAVGAAAAVAVGAVLVAHLLIVLFGDRTRRLVDVLRQRSPEARIYAIYFSRELEDKVRDLVPEAAAGIFNKHGAVQLDDDGIRIWAMLKDEPVAPTLVAVFAWPQVQSAVEESIKIEGSPHPGLAVAIQSASGTGAGELPIGVAGGRLGALYPSRRARSELLAAIASNPART